ncbi:hypothetical protein F444_17051 [Phytophthora nicotianae P1976]|uniref:PX domain-containing protein n=1 Tax=Phytophthora nicotianae P1976 TaxID=1317066 RepID=A0A080ZGC3_PHYNI|nr:hypothetical protein F444_17051 [Phytophthora nicotianae P1976]
MPSTLSSGSTAPLKLLYAVFTLPGCSSKHPIFCGSKSIAKLLVNTFRAPFDARCAYAPPELLSDMLPMRRRASNTRPTTSREPSVTPRSSTVVRESSEDLLLFREEAEYSEYLLAHVTGRHIERPGDAVVFYEVEVHLSKQQWRVVRRFSEFRTLRQQLIKHFSRNKRRRQPHCPICENVLASILDIAFPSRHVWRSHVFSSSSADALEDEMIRERKARFQQFVLMCLITLRSLRQHVRVKPDSAACEISVVLRMIEEFFGLSFTRYLAFLGERGIVDQESETSRHSLPLRKEDRAIFDVKFKEVM